MTKYKITIHCQNVSTFIEQEWENKNAAVEHYNEKIFGKKSGKSFRFGDILIQTDQITFVLVEEIVVATPENVTVDA